MWFVTMGTRLFFYQRNIMRTLTSASLFFAIATILATPLLASAQQAPSERQDAPPPPKLEKLEEGETPSVTIHEKKRQQTITETRTPNGQGKEAKVTKGKNTYYVKPVVRPGSAMPGDAQSPQSRPAQWEVYEFKNHKKQKESEVEPPPAPPAVAPPATEKK
jgi:hypothetical protein